MGCIKRIRACQLTFSSACIVLSAVRLFSLRVRMVLSIDWRGCMDRSNWWYMFLQNLENTCAHKRIDEIPKRWRKHQGWEERQRWTFLALHIRNRRERLKAILTWNCRAEWRAPAQGALQSTTDCRTDSSSSVFRWLEMPTASESAPSAWNTKQQFKRDV